MNALKRFLVCVVLGLCLAPLPSLALPGDIDSSFGAGSGITTGGFGYGHDVGRGSARQADGKVVVAGQTTLDTGQRWFSVVRYNADGTRDATFGQGGLAQVYFDGTESMAHDVAVQPDGKIVAVGWNFNGDFLYVAARLDPDGGLDPTFAFGGMFQLGSTGTGDKAYAVAIQPDGKIAIGGQYGSTGNNVGTIRLLANGMLDSSFGGGGVVPVNPLPLFPGTDVAVSATRMLAVQTILGEHHTLVVASTTSPPYRGFLVRVKADGSKDPAFGTGGVVGLPVFNDNAIWNAVAVDPATQEIVVAGAEYSTGTASSNIVALRFAPDGTPLATFGNVGLGRSAFGAGGEDMEGFGVAVDPLDGGVLVAGYRTTGTISQAQPLVVRFTAAGTLDPAFGAATVAPPAVGTGFAISVLPAGAGGAIATGEWTRYGYLPDFLVAGRTAAGAADAGFGAFGFADGDYSNGGAIFVSVAQVTDGGLVAAAQVSTLSGYLFGAARFAADGTPDGAYGNGGRALFDFGYGYNVATAIVPGPSGKVVVAGYAWAAPGVNEDFAAVRLNADGTVDTTFNGTGSIRVDLTGLNDRCLAAAVSPSGKIVLAGSAYGASGTQVAIVRLDADGFLDTTFNGTGMLAFPGAGGDSAAVAVKVLADESILVAGSTRPLGLNYYLAKITPAGALDMSFGTGGYVWGRASLPMPAEFAGFGVLADGSIVAGGTSGDGEGPTGPFFARFQADGSLDLTYGTNGYAIGPTSSFFPDAVVVEADGRAVAVGDRFIVITQDDIALFRADPGGLPDSSFGAAGLLYVDGGSDEVAAGAILQPDGRLVVTGHTGALGMLARIILGGGAVAPSEPLGVVATQVAPGTVEVVFTLPTSDGGSPYTQFEALSSPGGIVQSAPGTAFTFSGLTAGTTYTFTVRAFNSVGPSLPSAPSNAVTVYGPPAAASLGAGNGQSSAAGQPFASALTVTVTDALGQPVPGIGVGFVAPPGPGATALLSSPAATTDASGNASVTATANNMYGTYTVTPVVTGVSPPPFTLTNLGAGTQLAATQLGFGNRDVGTLSSSPPITVRNVGNTTLAIGAVSATGPGFSVTGTCAGATLAPNATCSVTARFQPAVEGQASGTIAFSTNAIAGPSSIILSGNGVDLSNPVGDADGDGIPNGVETSVNTDPRARDNDVFADARLFTMQQYRDFLNREGDPAGIEGWIAALNSGGADRPGVIDAFLSSDEFAGFVAPVVRLYFATFLRVPDYGGLTFNAGLVRAGTVTPAQLADFFTASPEFAATYGALDDPAFVTLLYANVLGRAPDPAGLAGWVGLLGSGYTRGQVLLGFSDSAEYQAAVANEVFVTMMYAGMLRRTPEPTGFNGWVGFLDAATFTRAQVINGFFLSTEYRGRFLP